MAGFVGVQIPPISTMANLTGRTITALQQQFSGHIRPRHGRLSSTTTRGSRPECARYRPSGRERPAQRVARPRVLCPAQRVVLPLDHSCSRRRRGLGGVRPCL